MQTFCFAKAERVAKEDMERKGRQRIHVKKHQNDRTRPCEKRKTFSKIVTLFSRGQKAELSKKSNDDGDDRSSEKNDKSI